MVVLLPGMEQEQLPIPTLGYIGFYDMGPLEQGGVKRFQRIERHVARHRPAVRGYQDAFRPPRFQ